MARIDVLEAEMANFKEWMEAHEARCEQEHREVQIRLRKVESTLWLASGMIIAAQGIFMIFFLTSVKSLLKLA